MKIQITKKLYAFIIAAMMFSASANAQIVYTDVNPDVTVAGNNQTYNIDLNHDGLYDCAICYHYFRYNINHCAYTYSYSIRLALSNGTAVAISSYPLKMNNNDIISSTNNWSTVSQQTLRSLANSFNCFTFGNFTYSGNWSTSTDGYLGIRLTAAGQTYYGWIRLSVNSPYSCIIKDYAYDSTPNHSIHAGATSGARLAFDDGNETEQNNSVSLFPNPASNKITLNISSLHSKNVEVKIIDLTGKIIFSHLYNLEDGNANIEIDIADLSKGMYLVQIQNKEFLQTEKLVVTK